MNTGGKTYYDPKGFQVTAPVADLHFWFTGRNRLICWALARYFPGMKSFCEVGCGGGIVLGAVERRFPGVRTIGVDYLEDGLEGARRRGLRADLRRGDILNLGSVGEPDVVGVFDVLEHIPDHGAACAGLHSAVKKGGGLVVTVPQHRFLWSFSDEMGLHQRRYGRGELVRTVEAAGFKVLRVTSFVSLLLPVLWLSRLRFSSGRAARSEFHPGRVANALCRAAMELDFWLIRAGFSLPMGGSLLLVAVRR